MFCDHETIVDAETADDNDERLKTRKTLFHQGQGYNLKYEMTGNIFRFLKITIS